MARAHATEHKLNIKKQLTCRASDPLQRILIPGHRQRSMGKVAFYWLLPICCGYSCLLLASFVAVSVAHLVDFYLVVRSKWDRGSTRTGKLKRLQPTLCVMNCL